MIFGDLFMWLDLVITSFYVETSIGTVGQRCRFDVWLHVMHSSFMYWYYVLPLLGTACIA